MKIVKSLLVAAVAALTLVSCQNKEDIKPLKETRKVHFVVNSSAPQTKSYIDNQHDGTYNVGWNAEDELAIFFGSVSKDNSDKADAIFTNTSEKGETASFEGDAEVESTEGTFFSFYPASALAKTYSGTVGVTVKDCQEPTYDSFDPSCDILVARPCTYLAGEGEIIINDLYFTRIMSVLKVNLVSSFEEISDDIVKNFKMEVPSNYILTGRPAVNLETAEISQWNIKNSYVEAKFNNDDVKVNTELENSVYLIVNPVTLASGSDLAFTIETENYNITKNAHLSKDMVFRQGNISVINLNITELDCEPKAAPKTIPYEEDFTKSEGSFTIDNVSLGDITYVWSLDNTFGFKASAFVNKEAHEAESWIVSPIIDLSNASGAVLTFDQALNKLNDGVRKDYVDVLIKVDGQDWETLSIDAYPAGSDWDFITSSANLYPFIGSKIKIGFKYTSSSSIAPTWEIKNFSVKEPITTLAFSEPSATIAVGSKLSNPASTNSPATVSYSSSAPAVATVDASGNINALSEGTCTITASVAAYQGFPAKETTCDITVIPASLNAEYKQYSGEITEGDYLITYGGVAMNTTVSSDRLQYLSITVNNNTVMNPDPSIVWHIAKSGDYWTIYNAIEKKYAASTGAKNKAQLLADGTDDKSLWTVSGTSTYEFVNKANDAASVNKNLRRNGAYGFACYGTGTGDALMLYKLNNGTTPDPQPTLVSIAITTAPQKVTYTAGEKFDPAGLVITKTMSDNSTEDVTYSGHEDEFTFIPSLTAELTTSDTAVQITYGGKSVNLTITVNAGGGQGGGTGETVTLFTEGFGDNSGSARAWNDSYKEQGGISSVYSGASYTMTNLKQGKNTTGATNSGINQTTTGTDAVFEFGPLNVSDYSGMVLTYKWKAGSIKGTYFTKVYYKTSKSGSYTEVSTTGAGATTFVDVTAELPAAANNVEALYLKIVFNTSNTTAIIDEVKLTGVN